MGPIDCPETSVTNSQPTMGNIPEKRGSHTHIIPQSFQYSSHYLGTCCIQHYYRWCAHLGWQQSTELTPHTGRFKWTRPFRRKTKSGFCACAITFQTQYTTGGSLGLLCVRNFIQFSERQASGTVLLLPARKLYWCRSHFSCVVWSKSTTSSLRTIKACELFHAHFNALFYSVHHGSFVLVSALQKIQNETYIQMTKVTTRQLKKVTYIQKRGQSPQTLDSVGSTWCQEPKCFHQCLTNFYQTHACFSLFFAFTVPLATSVNVRVIEQNITDTTLVKPQWAEIWCRKVHILKINVNSRY